MMAQPRIQCLNAARRVAQKSVGMRAPFSSSAVARAEDDPSRRTAAAGLLASLEDRSSSPLTTYRPPNPVSENSDSANSANSIRLPTGSQKYSNSPTSAGAERIASLITKAQARKRPTGRAPGQPSMSTVQELENAKRASDLSRQITRRWKAGDVYAPHDLSAVEMAKWKSRGKPTHDVFDVLDFNPLEHYRNFSVLSEYMTPMGRIKHSNETGLRAVNQRRMAKAIRRSIGMGMMPSVHRHPEILQKIAVRTEQMSPLTKGPYF